MTAAHSSPFGTGLGVVNNRVETAVLGGRAVGSLSSGSWVNVAATPARDLPAFTVVARVNTRVLSSKPWQALLNADGWSPRDVHLQFQGSRLQLAVNGN